MKSTTLLAVMLAYTSQGISVRHRRGMNDIEGEDVDPASPENLYTYELN